MLSLKKRGFTLIELLVVIAIIAILAAILFPVFARAREKARQTTCTSNQRQIAALMSMYVQDHEETMPLSAQFWSSINADPGVLVCPTLGKSTPNGYVYNANCSGISIGEFEDPSKSWVTADGKTVSTTAEVNIAEDSADTELRHSGQCIISYMDGHVGTQNTRPFVVPFTTNGLDMWIRADAITGLKTGDEITSWPASWGKYKITPSKKSGGTKFPQFSESGFKSKPCATFSNSTQGGYLATNYTQSLQNFTMVFVFSINDSWTGWCGAINKGDWNTGSGAIYFSTVANDGSYKFRTTTANMDLTEWNWNPGGVPTHSNNPPWDTQRYYTFQRSGTTLNAWGQGIAKTPVTGNANASDTRALQLFGPISGGSFTNTGSIAEFALFNRALSTAEVDLIHAYIKKRYSF